MEKNNLCSKLKTKQIHHDEYNKFKWDYNNHVTNANNNLMKEAEIMLGFSWPPRSYTCSFCKREFKSAQALGGHMNVHRRDRARLRLSPNDRDTLFLGLDHNLNPSLNSNPTSCSSNYNSSCTSTNPSLSSIFTKFPQFMMNSAILSPVCPLTANVGREDEVIKMEGHFGKLGECGVKKGVRLDLEIGLVSKSKDHQEIDLELRLGYT